MVGRRPAFFKFFVPETCIEQLKIPRAFNQLVQGVLPDEVRLRDRYNNLWPVKVDKVQNKFYFRDGWTDFVDDNFIEGRDIIFMEYARDGLFDTKIHGKDACEKEGVGGYRITNEQPMVSKEDDEEKDDEEHEVRTEDVEGNEDEEGNEEVDQHELEHEMDGDESGEEIPANNSAKKKKTKQGTSSSTTGKAKRVRRVSDIYGREFFRHRMMPVPANPYFLTKINIKRRRELYIPKEVIRDNKLDLPLEITMYDPKGRKWTAKGQNRKDRRKYYTTGWRSLCQRNLIGDDDVCVIEFIQRGGSLTIDVSIIRAPADRCSCQAQAKKG